MCRVKGRVNIKQGTNDCKYDLICVYERDLYSIFLMNAQKMMLQNTVIQKDLFDTRYSHSK
jgi:hypothetical protein